MSETTSTAARPLARGPWHPRRILIGYNVHGDLRDYLAERRPDLELRSRKLTEVTKDDVKWAEVYVGFRRPSIGDLGGVAWVHCVGAGVDAFLFPRALPDDVLLSRTDEPFGPHIAEYCLSRALATTQGMLPLAEEQRAHRWTPRWPELLRGRRVLIVGTGEVGGTIARLFDAVGCEVHGVSRSGRLVPPFRSVAPTSALAEAVVGADTIILAAPLTEGTYHMVNRRILEQCRGALLINVGRGALVDESVLTRALDEGWLRGAALDVFEVEPLPVESPLWGRGDVIVSPHIAGLTTTKGAGDGFLECLAAVERGEEPRTIVDRRRGY
jgi:phosphoglycerate dehydrogenase-like enzyme